MGQTSMHQGPCQLSLDGLSCAPFPKGSSLRWCWETRENNHRYYLLGPQEAISITTYLKVGLWIHNHISFSIVVIYLCTVNFSLLTLDISVQCRRYQIISQSKIIRFNYLKLITCHGQIKGITNIISRLKYIVDMCSRSYTISKKGLSLHNTLSRYIDPLLHNTDLILLLR